VKKKKNGFEPVDTRARDRNVEGGGRRPPLWKPARRRSGGEGEFQAKTGKKKKSGVFITVSQKRQFPPKRREKKKTCALLKGTSNGDKRGDKV